MNVFVSALIFAVTAGAAHAGTLTFDALDPYAEPEIVWQEQGLFGSPTAYNRAGAGSLYGPGGPGSPSATIARDTPFRPVSIEISGYGALNEPPEGFEWPGGFGGQGPAYDNLIFSGYLGDLLITEVALSMGADGSDFNYIFGPSFNGIDSLQIHTPYDFTDPSGWGCADCSAIEFDNLVYAEATPAIPLPAAAPLLLTALGALCLLMRRRGRAV